jgi:hypothetical protein
LTTPNQQSQEGLEVIFARAFAEQAAIPLLRAVTQFIANSPVSFEGEGPDNDVRERFVEGLGLIQSAIESALGQPRPEASLRFLLADENDEKNVIELRVAGEKTWLTEVLPASLIMLRHAANMGITNAKSAYEELMAAQVSVIKGESYLGETVRLLRREPSA